ncbi:MAG: Fic family protein [Cytophagaceae bacterium]|nr:Fic family protein [Cytophagaceae bacterium]
MKKEIQDHLNEIDELKAKLNQYRHLESDKVAKAFELEYTYESNRIEGNTLTLQETALVVEKGLTISGKSLQEHMEAINHTHAIEYVKDLVKDPIAINETHLLNIHSLILQSIDNSHAGKYRNVQVLISGAQYVPPQPYLVDKQMEDFFIWYETEKNNLHPVILSAELHERLVTIHPFIDGNGRTSRLLMNLVLLQNGYPIAILKGDAESRLQYYKALEVAQTEHNKEPFFELIAANVKATLNKVLQTLGQ